MASLQELAQQLINLDQALQAANGKIDALQIELTATKQEVADAKKGQGSAQKKFSLIMDGKKLYPDALKDGKGFVKWSESFLRWVKCENPDLKELFSHAGRAKHPIALVQCPPEWREHVTFIYSPFQKLLLDTDDASLVRRVTEENALEVWRKLVAKRVPRSLAAKGMRLRAITNFGAKHKAKSNSQVQDLIDDYESRIGRFMVDYSVQVEPVTEDIKKDCLMQIVPEKLENALKDSIMAIERDGNELDYASLRALILKRVEGDNEQAGDPMDVGQVVQQAEQGAESEVNALNSKGQNGGKGQPVNSCNRCWQQGHYARDWDLCPKGGGKGSGTAKGAPSGSGGKKGDTKGGKKGKQKGGKGKGKAKGKGSVNEVGQWGDEEWTEETAEQDAAGAAGEELEQAAGIMDFDGDDLADVWSTNAVDVVDEVVEICMVDAKLVGENMSMFDRGKVAPGTLIEIPEQTSMFDVGKQDVEESAAPANPFLNFAGVKGDSVDEWSIPGRDPWSAGGKASAQSSPETPQKQPTEFIQIYSRTPSSTKSALSPDFVRKFMDPTPPQTLSAMTPSTSSSSPATGTALDASFLKKFGLGVPGLWANGGSAIETDEGHESDEEDSPAEEWDDHAAAFMEVEMGGFDGFRGKGNIDAEVVVPKVSVQSAVANYERKINRKELAIGEHHFDAENGVHTVQGELHGTCGKGEDESAAFLQWETVEGKERRSGRLRLAAPRCDGHCEDLRCQELLPGKFAEETEEYENGINEQQEASKAKTAQAKKTDKQERKIARAKAKLEEEMREAFDAGGEVEVWTRLILSEPPGLNQEEQLMQELLAEMDGAGCEQESLGIVFKPCEFCCGSDLLFKDECPVCDGTKVDPASVPDEICPLDLMCMTEDAGKKREAEAGNGQWRRLRVAMDSGANVDVMPEDVCEHVPVGQCTGPRRGKKLAAANGTLIETSGEKHIVGLTDAGENIDWRFIAGKVKKALKSTATTCDEKKWVIHTEAGGWIIDVASKRRIPLQRVGNSYIVDVWVKVPKPGFSRPSAR